EPDRLNADEGLQVDVRIERRPCRLTRGGSGFDSGACRKNVGTAAEQIERELVGQRERCFELQARSFDLRIAIRTVADEGCQPMKRKITCTSCLQDARACLREACFSGAKLERPVEARF